MTIRPDAEQPPADHAAVLAAPEPPRLDELLARAAAGAIAAGVDLDGFMKAAWSAYVAARPGLREHLEELRVVAHLEELRKRGRVGAA